jgi:hypothetical protein
MAEQMEKLKAILMEPVTRKAKLNVLQMGLRMATRMESARRGKWKMKVMKILSLTVLSKVAKMVHARKEISKRTEAVIPEKTAVE